MPQSFVPPIMASTAAVGHLIGRRQSGLHALMLTAAVMCLFNPNLPWDVSFQLSFMATLGLVLFAQPMQESLRSMMEKRLGDEKAARISSPISEYFLFTLAAQFTTLPVIAIQFKRISLVVTARQSPHSPCPANLLVMGMVTTSHRFDRCPWRERFACHVHLAALEIHQFRGFFALEKSKEAP